jgi:N-acetylglucosaminyl-diphospho-decaprenol L-rhamnosyltransferase
LSYSIAVVTWECAGRLRALVDSMNRHLEDEVELVVADNASTDDPFAAARDWKGETVLIRLEGNLGFGAGSNAAVAAARHEGVVLLNPDTVLLDSGLDEVVGIALARRALAGPRLLNPDGGVQPSASGPPAGIWPWIGALVPGALQPAPLKARTEPWRLDRTTRVAWLTGACVAGPRDVLGSLGPFDPAIHMYAEDMDLGLRAGRAGIASWFCPDVCRIVHHGGASAALLYPEGNEAAVASNRRAVLRRAYGPRREWAAWLAQRLNLRLRATAKRALGREAERDRAALAAARVARASRRL